MTPADRLAAARTALAAAEAELRGRLATDRSRRRGDLVRQLHEVRQHLRPTTYRYLSQAGQDATVDAILGQRTGGTFVDIGGYDGVTGSNSLFFERWRGWRGILVEPVPAMLERARAVRRCDCLGLAIAAADGEADFIEVSEGYTQMSGLAATYDATLLGQVRARSGHRETTLRVPTRTLQGLLDEHGLTEVDFLSIDIEGGEVAALGAFPFGRFRIAVWSIENNTANPDIGRIMVAAGYRRVEFCGQDEIWRSGDL